MRRFRTRMVYIKTLLIINCVHVTFDYDFPPIILDRFESSFHWFSHIFSQRAWWAIQWNGNILSKSDSNVSNSCESFVI